jgi:hypothetical protein
MIVHPDRYRIVGGPWPERVGLIAHIVYPSSDHGVYPFGGWHRAPDWSCVMYRNDLVRAGKKSAMESIGAA